MVECGALGAQQTDLFSVITDRAFTMAGVDLQTGEVAQFGTHGPRIKSDLQSEFFKKSVFTSSKSLKFRELSETQGQSDHTCTYCSLY